MSMPKAATLLVIRHAEKSGDRHDVGLTPAGMARAQAYVAYFQNLASGASRLPPPAWLIAAADARDSRRSRLTLEPLAAALGLDIDARLADTAYRALAERLHTDPRYDHATILICWTHKKLRGLAKALGAPDTLLPDKWPDEVFDWLLRFDYDVTGALTAASLIPQRLMYGDSDD
ncbi:histidine phosphatase family protein [Lysobacter sp. TY2-98]|uniref:histidine phosphatase family protein n=1 Tax=Lysobacter sp. TY2-98 TaxID=2290922 RepID=UPI000E205681|nr:histidine phosphatase family protein [Lysobacter sp. TY2-98]AXK73423.1 histidine phosphatase family protein [Lysobacter sp. TY2-98]